MIALILGTSEGREILSLLNNYTEDIIVSTATEYGGELLSGFKFKSLNSKPLDYEGLRKWLMDNEVKLLADASHPYAQAVSKNASEACKDLGIPYLRYERPSIVESFQGSMTRVGTYEELYEKLKDIQGTILNTTGSRNIEKLVDMKLKSRIVHRVLPSVEVMEKCVSLGVKPEDILAIKGPISYELNCAFIKEYDAKAIILKDSGLQGGTEEKLRAALDLGIQVFLIERSKLHFDKEFSEVCGLVNYIVDNFNYKK